MTNMKKLIIKLGLMVFLINGCGTEPIEIPGCVDSQACNFNSDATLDDNSCIYQIDCLGECGGINLNCCIDYNGNMYETIIIGDQEWMAENLRVTHYQNGEPIQYVQSELYEPDVWKNLTSGAYGFYNDEHSIQGIYGNLYNWYAVVDDREICPLGWHIPTDDEWKELEIALGMSQSEADGNGWRGTDEGSKLAGNADLWSNGNLESNAEFGTVGFNGLPSGSRSATYGDYNNIGNFCYFWSTNEQGNNDAWNRTLYYNSAVAYRNNGSKGNGISVRCVRPVE